MTFLFLVLASSGLFAMLLAFEASKDGSQSRLNPVGLFTWLVSGNWPAKVGGGLMIIGMGALLRYAFANIDIPPELKLSGGAVVAAALGFSALLLKGQPKRRAIHLALSGAAFGVAYLTAYSAYGFFSYINDINALALLALVATAAGIFAVTSNAMSVAILAMVGAYIAPKFAIGTPTVISVYGYYLAASTLCLIMVTLRGWRPLIHLSFLFTLAGSVFFAWDSNFYAAEHYSSMQPLLLALTAVHLLMPLLERKHAQALVMARFDLAYFIALPVVAAALTLKIASDWSSQGAYGLAALAAIWALATVILQLLKSSQASRHGTVTSLLLFAAVVLYAPDIPLLLVGLGLSVAWLAAGAKLNWHRSTQEIACGAATLFGILHVVFSIFHTAPHTVFFNDLFAQRMIACALMILGAWIGMRQSMAFAKVLGLSGFVWAVLSILSELLRLNIDFLPQLVYGLVLGSIGLSIVFNEKMAAHPFVGGLLIFTLTGCGWWAMHGASSTLVIVYMVTTALALLGMAWSGRDSVRKDGSDFSPSMAIGLLPFALLPWAISTAELHAISTDFFEATIAIAGVGVAGWSARLWLSDSPRWNHRIQPLHVYATAFALLSITLFHIERGAWPIAFEVLALTYLVVYVKRRSQEQAGVPFGVGSMMVLSVALVLQAMLLRAFGPDGTMDASDINQMHLPAVASLMWAVFGASLAWWGTHGKSRSMWSAGSVLLVLAATKLVLFDFGTLGELGNIIAFIAAGVVFLAVAWFAPIPPKAALAPVHKPAPQPLSNGPLSSESMHRTPSLAQPPSPVVPTQQATARSSATKSTASSSRYREEPKGFNGLWILLLVIAILIAMVSSVWHKHSRHQLRLQQSRHQLVEKSVTSAPQNELAVLAPAEPTTAPASETVQTPLPQPALPRAAPAPAIGSGENSANLVDACTSFTAQLPSDYVLLAGGEYKGRSMQGQDTRSREMGRFDVNVDAPGKKVVVALGAYEPSLWSIHATPSTTIVGVLVSGYHSQKVMGLRPNIPLLNATYESKSPCGYFYVTRSNASQTDTVVRKIFGRPAEVYALAMDGRLSLSASSTGTTSLKPSSTKIERYVDENGHTGFRQSMER